MYRQLLEDQGGVPHGLGGVSQGICSHRPNKYSTEQIILFAPLIITNVLKSDLIILPLNRVSMTLKPISSLTDLMT